MSILTSMNTAISGLQATGTAMGVIGDNIANANTTGFKSSRVEFQDVVASNLKGILGGNQIGKGVRVGGVTAVFSQGDLTPTERDSDMGIRGDGFFVLKGPGSSGEISYTRDGAFRFDDKGRLVTSDNQLIQGYRMDPTTGKAGSTLVDIEFNSNTIPAKGTSEVKMLANLDVRVEANKLAFAPDKAEKDADLTTTVRVYDTAGSARNLNVHFYKREGGQWQWHATGDGGEIQGGTKGTPIEVASGVLKFTQDGKLESDEITMSNISFNGSQPNQKIDFNFGDSIITRNGTGMAGTTQYGSKSQIFKQVQDGNSAGSLTNFSIDERGVVSGSYNNGITRPLAQLAIARFENNEGLFKLGANRYKEAVLSGQPIVGAAGEAGRGAVIAKNLERSNVDIAQQFVNMIQTQRNFQANAKTITTSDELLQDVINLRR